MYSTFKAQRSCFACLTAVYQEIFKEGICSQASVFWAFINLCL